MLIQPKIRRPHLNLAVLTIAVLTAAAVLPAAAFAEDGLVTGVQTLVILGARDTTQPIATAAKAPEAAAPALPVVYEDATAPTAQAAPAPAQSVAAVTPPAGS